MIRSNAMRRAAKGETCTVQIAGVCNGDWATTVLAHLPDESHGMGRKSDEISAAFCCSSCHDAIDGRSYSPEFAAHRDLYMRRAMVRTWRRLIELGVIQVAA